MVAAAVGLWLLSLLASRLLATSLARLATTRRGRDMAVALGALMGVSGLAWGPLINAVTSVDYERYVRLANVVRWTPAGALGRAIVTAGAGSMGPTLVDLVIGLGGLLATGGLWWLALGRADGTHSVSGRQVSTAVATGAPLAPTIPEGIFAGVLCRLPSTPTGAVTARELRYLVRDPRQRVSTATLVVLAVVLPLVNVAGSGRPQFTLLGSSAALLGTLGAMNQIGVEGRSLWIHLLSGVPAAAYLRGKNLALVIYLTPIGTLSSIILAALTAGWRYLPAAVLGGIGALVAGIGVGTVTSVMAPAPVPEGNNPFAATSGAGCVAGLLLLASMTAAGVIMAPIAISFLVCRDRPALCAVIGAVAVGYGLAVRALCERTAAARMAGREPELLQATTPVG